jgi:hypothetical protein
LSCLFSFKREAKVYVVYAGAQYLLDVSEIDFSQTFTEHSYSNKTIQVQNMFEQSVINKANPANFTLTFPAIREADLEILFDRALDYQSFDLYIETQDAVFMIQGCVVSNMNFVLEKFRALQVSIEGQGVRLYYLGEYGNVVIGGTPQARSGTRTYNQLSHINIVLNETEVVEPLTSISIELNNELSWTPYTTATHAMAAADANSSMYPEGYTMKKRDLSGSFAMYKVETPAWGVGHTLHIEVGQKEGVTLYGFDFYLPKVAFQRMIVSGDIFRQRYTWRLTENPQYLSDFITYKGL